MSQEKPSIIRRMGWLIGLAWTVSILVTATLVGGYAGWVNHGLVGALALGLAGLIIGGLLSSPRTVLQLLD